MPSPSRRHRHPAAASRGPDPTGRRLRRRDHLAQPRRDRVPPVPGGGRHPRRHRAPHATDPRAAARWRPTPVRDRLVHLHRIRSPDPDDDHLTIYQTMLRYEFPWDMKLGPDQPDPPLPPHQRRPLPLRPRLPGRDPHPLAGTLRLAPTLPPRATPDLAVLPRVGSPDGNHRNPRLLPGGRGLVRRVRPGPTAPQRRRGRDRAGHPDADAEPATRCPLPGGQRTGQRHLRPSPTRRNPGGEPTLAGAGRTTPGLRARAHTQRWLGGPPAVPGFADGIKTKSYPHGYDISQLGPSPPTTAGDTPAPNSHD